MMKNKLLKVILSLSLVLYASFSTIIVINASDDPTVTNSGDGAITVNLNTSEFIAPDLLLSNFSSNVVSGKVLLNNVPSGTTISYTPVSGISVSYDASKGLYNLSGSSSALNYQTLLRSFKVNAGANTTSSMTVSFSVSTSSDSGYYYADTGHYYDFISYAGRTWYQAASDAETRYYNGRQGYLVTIMSAEENAYVSAKVNGKGWIGAGDATTEGIWRWETGPEAGTHFWTGDLGAGSNSTSNVGSAMPGMYANWVTGEPNNANGPLGGEDHAHIFPNGGWNDYHANYTGDIEGYLIEYGGMPGDVVLDLEETVDVNIVDYRVNFNSNGGSSVSSIYPNIGSTFTKPANPTRSGYTFNEWYKEITLDNLWDFDNDTLTGLTNLYAKWDINQYTISFNADGGSSTDAITQDYNTVIPSVDDPTKTGYTFAGWNPGLPTNMPAGNTTQTATWTINEYTISFDSDGGSSVASITQDYDTVIPNVESPTKTGYTFAGWSPGIPTNMPAANTTQTATWTANTYTISFDSDGGSAVDAITQDYNTVIPSVDDPTKVGYTFSGWNPGLPTNMPAGNTTQTATWTINEYTITFDSDGGSSVASITQDYDTVIPSVEAPTKTGYTFNGWNPGIPANMPAENTTQTAIWVTNEYTITFDSAGGSSVSSITQDFDTEIGEIVPPEKTGYSFTGWSPGVPETMPAENTTQTATWQINEYTITFDSNGGSEVDSITLDYNEDVSIPASPTRIGYTFNGWSPSVPSTMPGEDTTVTAIWVANPYTITFDSNGGTVVESLTRDYDTYLPTVNEPTRIGYTFTGWSPGIPEKMPAENTTQTATWQVNTYTITFNTNGGSAIAKITLDYGDTVERPNNPTRALYIFNGWSDEIPETMPAENLTINAIWRVNEDYDNDGVKNDQEEIDGTDPFDADSDDDGLSDGLEKSLNTNPMSADSDKDGLTDQEEVELQTNPLLEDSDNDGASDFDEINDETDPNDDQSYDLRSILSDTELAQYDANLLTYESGFTFASQDNWDFVSSDFNLINEIDFCFSSTVEWTSSNKDLLTISSDNTKAIVTQSSEAVYVALTAKVTYQTGSVTKSFLVVIAPNGLVESNSETKGSNVVLAPDDESAPNVSSRRSTFVNDQGETEEIVDYINIEDNVVERQIEEAKKKDEDQITLFFNNQDEETKDVEYKQVVQVTSSSMKKMIESKVDLKIKTAHGEVVIPAKSMEEFANSDSGMGLIFTEITNDDSVDMMTNGVNNHMSEDKYSVKKVFQIVSNRGDIVFEEGIKVTIPFGESKYEDYDNLGVYIKHHDGTEEVQDGEVIYDDDGNPFGIRITINKLSEFAIYNVVKPFNYLWLLLLLLVIPAYYYYKKKQKKSKK